MKRLNVAAALVLTVLLGSSLLVTAILPQQHQNPVSSSQSSATTPLALLATPAGAWAFSDGQYLSANMSTRGEIMAFILANPGVYLREISEDLGLSMGTVQYHTWVLYKNGEIEECRAGRYRRFFGAAKFGDKERKVISLLRQGTAGRILTVLSVENPLTHTQLAALLGLSSQALTWHMKKLEGLGIVEAGVFQGQSRRTYRLVDDITQEVKALVRPIPGLVQAPTIR